VFWIHGSARRIAAELGLTAALVTLTVSLLPPAAATPRLSPRALVSGLAAIPGSYLTWYREAAGTCPGLHWETLAGIGTIESDNGRSQARGVHYGKNRRGAEGPMQFEPPTFAEYAVRADRSARLTPYNPQDAIFTAARMLCADGGGTARGLPGAIFAYNHARWYVRDVLAVAARYTAAAGRIGPRACRTPRRGSWHRHHRRRHPGSGWRPGHRHRPPAAGRRAPRHRPAGQHSRRRRHPHSFSWCG
jgi:hypothetical protein